jgi:hypothetical protein
MSVPWTIRGRELVFNGIQDLPSILIVGGLLLGGMSGSVPLIVMALGGLASSSFYLFLQNILSSLGLSIFRVPYNPACVSHKTIGYYDVKNRGLIDETSSTWLFTVCYFIGYLFYNALTITLLDPTTKDDIDKVNSRKAQGISIMIALAIMLILFIGFRWKSKCENKITGPLGVLLGLGLGIGFFIGIQSSDLRIADVLQIKQGMEPINSLKGSIKPIVCTSSE